MPHNVHLVELGTLQLPRSRMSGRTCPPVLATAAPSTRSARQKSLSRARIALRVAQLDASCRRRQAVAVAEDAARPCISRDQAAASAADTASSSSSRSSSSPSSPSCPSSPSSSSTAAIVRVVFQQAGQSIDVAPGTNLYEAAQAAGADTITVGCCQGACGICEVEVVKRGPGSDGTPTVVRSCVVAVPPGYDSLEVNELVDDIWGVDGYDT